MPPPFGGGCEFQPDARSLDWQEKCEGGTFARFTLDLDPPAVGLGQFLADSQPQPDAFELGGEERLEQFLQVFGRDSRAGIFNSNQ